MGISIRKHAALCAALIMAAALSAPPGAAAETASPMAVWENFRAGLRRGDYDRSYDFFSPASRRVFPREDFLREYHPVGPVCPRVLAEPEDVRMSILGEWAELHLTIRRNDRPLRLRVAFAREDGMWRLVAARREKEERWEAQARAWLMASAAVSPDAAGRKTWLETNRGAGDNGPGKYRLEIRTDGLWARPTAEGLRTFVLAADGGVTVPGAGRPNGPDTRPAGAIIAPSPVPAPRGGLPPPAPGSRTMVASSPVPTAAPFATGVAYPEGAGAERLAGLGIRMGGPTPPIVETIPPLRSAQGRDEVLAGVFPERMAKD